MILKHKPRCPFPYFGGKGNPKIKNSILKLLPKHQKYIEPFGGGASILISKMPADVEIYNDVNRGIVNFFRVVSDPDLFAKLMSRISSMPVSRELFEEYARTWPSIHDQIEQAVRWYYTQRNSYAGEGTTFAVSMSTSSKMGNTIAAFKSALDVLPSVHDRMSRVVIECVDWREALKMYDGSEWLAYCDPPYVSGARKSGGYAHELTDRDHEELIKILLQYKGSIVLSGYDSPIYAPLKDAGWKMSTVDVTCSAAGRTRISGLQGIGNVLAKQTRTECIWCNPHAIKNTQ